MSKTTTKSGRTGRAPRRVRGRQSARTGSFEIFSYPHHSAPALVLGVLWRWRVELLTLTTLVVVWAVLAQHLPATWPTWATPAVMLTAIAVVLAVPVSRRLVTRRVWCVISRHRVRKCFVQSRVMTHEGLLPLFIWTRPTPVGDRLRLWLRPGLSGRDIENVTDRIAAACWARDARVRISPKRASTIWVDVIRRDPLAATGQITSPLLDGVHTENFDADADVIPLPDRATITPAIPDPAPGSDDAFPPIHEAPATPVRATKRTGTRTAPPAEHTDSSAAVVVGWSGKDVSDYV
ncbi:MAG: hypothetical protein ACRDRR_02130 [Pseudonocardiaceae bacterium]